MKSRKNALDKLKKKGLIENEDYRKYNDILTPLEEVVEKDEKEIKELLVRIENLEAFFT